MSNINRRDFLKRAAVGAAVVAGSGVLAACGAEQSVPVQAPAETPTEVPVETGIVWDYETDVVVAGGGNGGLSAASSAAEEGKKVILLEISGIVGGGSAWSGGSIHVVGALNYEQYSEYTEDMHDPLLAKTFIEAFRNDYLPWLDNIGAPTVPGNPRSWGAGLGEDPLMGKEGDLGHTGKRRFFKHISDYAEDKGTTVMLNTKAHRLMVDEDGKLIGLQAMDKSGKLINIKAKSIILATGNFMGNKEMLQKYIGPYADRAISLGTPYNTGHGIYMAQSVGAMMSGSMSSWSGIYCAVTPVKPLVEDPVEYEKIIAEDPDTMPRSGVGRLMPPMWVGLLDPLEAKGLLVNLDGKRFKDESCPINSKYARLPQSILHEREGIAFMIADEIVAEDTPGSNAMVDAIIAEGGKVVIADTLEELAEGLGKQGVYKNNFIKTIKEYNAAIDAGKAGELEVPRMNGHYKIETPPFYAVPTTSQIYCTFGGIEINEKSQVLDYQKKPIQGLYAVPPAAGGVFNTIYMGGIAMAGTFGYIAGKNV